MSQETGKKPAIALIGDGEPFGELRARLEREGYSVAEAHTWTDGLELLKGEPPDVVVLDGKLPDRSAFHVLQKIREDKRLKDARILVTGLHGNEQDRIAAIEAGADQCLDQPFSASGTMAHVQALLRRIGMIAAPDEILTCGKLEMNLTRHRLVFGAVEIEITKGADWSLLKHLLGSLPGTVHSRRNLMIAIYGNDHEVGEQTIDVRVGRVNKVLIAAGVPPR